MKHPTYKLDYGGAAAMRRAHAGGRPVRTLAREHGVSLPTVRAVVRYARYLPSLSSEQQARLASLSEQLRCTRDEALDLVFASGMRAALEGLAARDGFAARQQKGR